MHATDLANLTRRYFAEVAAVNAAAGPCEDLYAAASRTLHALVGVPVRGRKTRLAQSLDIERSRHRQRRR